MIVDVIINDLACVSRELKQFRFPKSKRLRIRKKWSKNRKNFRLTDVHKCIKFGNTLIVSSKTFDKIKRHI
jgi:hypothetical protein